MALLLEGIELERGKHEKTAQESGGTKGHFPSPLECSKDLGVLALSLNAPSPSPDPHPSPLEPHKQQLLCFALWH